MNVELTEAQIRYVMSKIEPDAVAGIKIADEVERELDLVLMDDERKSEGRRNLSGNPEKLSFADFAALEEMRDI